MLIVVIVLFTANLFAQSSKQVKWVFSATKKTAGLYEIRLKASIGGNYHIYAQNAGGGVGLPTKFKFNKNPLLTLDGNVSEKGKLIEGKETIGKSSVTVRYYNGVVEFVQVVKAKAATNISGNVQYMVCNNSGCLPPSTTSFDIELK